MKTIKEKPKKAKAKKSKGQSAARSQPAISAKQAAKLLKDKYAQQLDRRKPEAESAETQAVEQVEGAGSWAVDELLTHERPRSSRQPDQKIKERPQDGPEPAGPSDAPPAAPDASPRNRCQPPPAARAHAQGEGRPGEGGTAADGGNSRRTLRTAHQHRASRHPRPHHAD